MGHRPPVGNGMTCSMRGGLLFVAGMTTVTGFPV
jgi:hypothetical protein